MKVAINVQADIQEIEVIINCMAEDENVQRIVSALDSLDTKLCCRRQGELFQIALNDILYIESVDRKTFIYTEQQIYETDKRLYELENHLKNRSFFRVSKAVIINLKRTKSRAVKKTLSIPEWLNEAACNAGLNFSQVLQEALIVKLNAK